jgi:hypothetical protein
MKLDINEVYHQYIIRIIIFSLFANKNLIRQPNVYKQAVQTFLKKRLPWKIYLSIDTGEKLSLDDERELILDELLNGVKTDYLKVVIIKFTTPLKDIRMAIDLGNEAKYQDFLYS